jgi:hypothetical protein
MTGKGPSTVGGKGNGEGKGEGHGREEALLLRSYISLAGKKKTELEAR